MTTQTTSASVTLPVSQAIDRVKLLLFRPFNLGKWFTIGFCAWLAHLGESGYNFNFRGGSGRGGGNIREEIEHARSYVMDNLGWIVPLVIVLVVIGLTLGVVMVWLSSRGKFMFLHCVALDKAEVRVPWRKFAREGNSLFVFRLVLALIGLVPALPLVALAVVMVWRMFQRGTPDLHGILMLVGDVLALMAVSLVFLVITKLTTDFVVPIMFLRGNKCMDGWRELRGLISGNVAHFVLYLLFQIVLAIAAVMVVVIAILVTCCTAACVMIIPYLGTVLLLPVLMLRDPIRFFTLRSMAGNMMCFRPSRRVSD